MNNIWDTEEIELLRYWISIGWTHKSIANELDRSEKAVNLKAYRLGFKSKNKNTKTHAQYLTEVPKDFIVLETYISDRTKILHKHKDCGYEWKVKPNNIINGQNCPICSIKASKRIEQYREELPNDIEVLGIYINTKTKILHKHSCGHTWMIEPYAILKGNSCPKCAKYGFNISKEASLYIVEFPELNNLQKVGISNNYKRRFFNFGYKPKVILIIPFNLGKDALLLEKQYLRILKPYMVNTGLLKSGNTETFRYE